ncbi:hypothetical protein [Paenibacillus sp. B2(2019)]|uniref:hypothetical protein n=1 Tax=Paenibacillus sp. B2(2019) TaxID=2607754 RepID=UPI000FA2DCAF|nr:hypothetical protein [Paenibacillus sp. B2(2019)]
MKEADVMDQNEAIRIVSLALIKDSAVRAVFLKGSHAREKKMLFQMWICIV